MAKAKSNVFASMGLDEKTPANELTHEQRHTFKQKLAQEVMKYPASFSPQHLETARLILNTNYAPLVDDGFDIGDMLAETVEQGKTVIPAFSWNLFRIASAVAVLWLLFVVGKNEPRRS